MVVFHSEYKAAALRACHCVTDSEANASPFIGTLIHEKPSSDDARGSQQSIPQTSPCESITFDGRGRACVFQAFLIRATRRKTCDPQSSSKASTLPTSAFVHCQYFHGRVRLNVETSHPSTQYLAFPSPPSLPSSRNSFSPALFTGLRKCFLSFLEGWKLISRVYLLLLKCMHKVIGFPPFSLFRVRRELPRSLLVLVHADRFLSQESGL